MNFAAGGGEKGERGGGSRTRNIFLMRRGGQAAVSCAKTSLFTAPGVGGRRRGFRVVRGPPGPRRGPPAPPHWPASVAAALAPPPHVHDAAVRVQLQLGVAVVVVGARN